MKIMPVKGVKKLYKGMNWYNRKKMIAANRPCGKEKRKQKKNA